ncbi:MAG: DNA-directed RNA polymerase subunit beta [Chitinophagaceae bacterium]|nr:DNA-directed RNA polymerase subunit beta [Chitinophagaceae bacterium]
MNTLHNTKRINFAKVKIPKETEFNYPNFLDIQTSSFQEFIQLDIANQDKKKQSLYQLFCDIFPISDARKNFTIEFVDYSIDIPRYSIEECIDRGLTYSVPFKVKFKVTSYSFDNKEPTIYEQEIFLGNIPYMTQRGSFVINGAERVIVSQLHRSPGVFFAQSRHTNGTKLYSARVIPFTGAWIEFATDANNIMYAYIDRKKKFPITTLLRAIGYSTDKSILDIFGLSEDVPATRDDLMKNIGRKLAARVIHTYMEDFIDEDTGEVISIERNQIKLERDYILKEEDISIILESKVSYIIVHREDINLSEYSIIYNTLQKDSSNSTKEAVEQIYRQLRNAEAPDEQTAKDIIHNLFFSEKRYDLGKVGRYRINKKLKMDSKKHSESVLTVHDIIEIIKYLVGLVNSRAIVDDIDHLGNRKVRTVGEQLYNLFYVGLSRMARIIADKMNMKDVEEFKPIDLVSPKTLITVINSFFGTSQLSQFMDQTNPLAEITHKRRLTALGPGGLSRDRAGFEVRDIHYTHYGRLCTIETPEGPNIGLISSLCVYAKINPMGFIETPYRKVKNGKVTDDIVYLSAEEEENCYIAQSHMKLDNKGFFLDGKIKSRYGADFPLVSPDKISYMDIAPDQIVSIGASLIPFLEHDDANRALMGSNMQRQAVPLILPEAPIVATGFEHKLIMDSKNFIISEKDGIVKYVDSTKIIIENYRTDFEKQVSFDDDEQVYSLPKYRRTNQDTVLNMRPIVFKGDEVKQGQILCEGFATEKGELALGRNLKVAFMPWQGYNFEDAIVISEKVVSEDIFTSVHIEEFRLGVKDMKRGEEELTSEIPNMSDEVIKNLDENGIVRVGSPVKEGDILIGKITPKGESDPSPEEKLLKAIFGNKAGDVKDASFRAPASLRGVVINTQLFSRIKKDNKTKIKKDMDLLKDKYSQNLSKLKRACIEKLTLLLDGKICQGIKHRYSNDVISHGVKLNGNLITEMLFPNKNNYRDESGYSVPEETNLIADVVFENWTDDIETNKAIVTLLNNYSKKWAEISANFKKNKYILETGDELPTEIVKLAKVYVAKKRKLKVGDKMAGRHGNKGVVAKIVRQEDMPFMEDGTPVDVVLNPLGVPSRMNIGQIYETVLGWAGLKLGIKYTTHIFDGATLQEVSNELKKAGLPPFGRDYLYDGLTGEKFEQPVTVGVIYMLKLGHLVDDKMHARSIGPYSLITQQPLGGKAQFGGQRFGEMEVWAIEAFGASHILQEILTIKSDDVVGRAKAYESIVKGESLRTPGIPESFNVLIQELRGLGLEINLEK